MEDLYEQVVSISSSHSQLSNNTNDILLRTFVHNIVESIQQAAALGETSVPIFVHTEYRHLVHTSLPQALAPFKLTKTSSPYYIRVTWQQGLSST